MESSGYLSIANVSRFPQGEVNPHTMGRLQARRVESRLHGGDQIRVGTCNRATTDEIVVASRHQWRECDRALEAFAGLFETAGLGEQIAEQVLRQGIGGILREHATIGMAYGAQDLAHDIRLACHGIDAEDNEFVIGLVGKELHPLSHLVQRMRKTQQTSLYLERLGPFFVGRVRWQSTD